MKNDDNKKKYFDDHARGWERNFPPEVLKKLNEIILSLGIKNGDRVLDLGCGYGVLYPVLKPIVGDNGIIFGIDNSIGMLKYKRHSEDITYKICGDSSAIPFADLSFNSVIVFAAFPHFNDKPMACRETARVLRNGGKFHVIHLLSSEEICCHHRNAGGAVANDILPNKPDFIRMLNDSGFTNTTIEDISGKYLMSSEKEI
ncbi:MAG: methyltransferase domain-containing protein [candidate division Zixibacteria bacterium]|nr:methyltransferase domain-containing protein [candidate division Zixibacteria bacterium]